MKLHLVGQLLEQTDKTQPKYSGKKWSQCHSIHHKSLIDWHRLNSVLRGQRHTTETTRVMVRPVYRFIRRFAQLRKLTINVFMSVCPQATGRLPLDGFSWNFVFECFLKICRESSRFIKIWQEERALYVNTNIHFWSYLTQFFLEWKMFQTKVVEKIKTHILHSIIFFFEKCAFYKVT